MFRYYTVVVFVALAIFVCESKRGGGSSSGGSRSSRSSGGRSSSSSASRYSRIPSAYNARSWTSRSKSTAIKAGSIYMASRLQRIHYRDSTETYDESVLEMEICRNTKKYPAYNSSQKVYGWFICPTASDKEDEKFCCGAEDDEKCCVFWSSGAGHSAIAYIVLGCFGVIVIIGVVLWINPEIIETLIEVLCCPCFYISKCCRRIRSAREARRREQRRRVEATVVSDEIEVDICDTIKGEPTSANVPAPPPYNQCVRRSSLESDHGIDIGFKSGNPCPDDQDNSHVPSCPTSNHYPSYRSPSPPTYRSPSPPTYRSPSPPRYRSSSPVRGGRSSPSRHSFSSNHS